MLGGRLRRSDRGSTSTLGLAVAAIVFASAFVVAQLIVAHPTGIDGQREVYDAQASTALNVLVGTAGGATSGAAWVTDPDHIARFGLAKDDAPNFLDYAKIRALRNGTMTATANAQPDYPDVLAAMGITSGDVHLRTYPALPTFDDPRFVKEPDGRFAYLAHYSGASAAMNLTTSIASTSSVLNLSMTVRNDAAANAIFTVDATLGGAVTQERNTRLLAPGESQTLYVSFERLPSWTSSYTSIVVDATDPYGNAATDANGARVGPQTYSATPPTGGSNAYDLSISAASLYNVAGATVTFALDDYDGNGARVNNAQARFVLVGPNGNEWQNTTVALDKNKQTLVKCANCTTTGLYTGIVWDTGVTRRGQDQEYVSAATMFTEKSTMASVAANEVNLTSTLVSTFNPTRYDSSTNPQGDVFGDDVNGATDITGVMSRYTTIIIGSEISQNCLTPSSVKNAIADWVQAGGNLVVLGTYDSQSRWLEPIYHAAQTTANGGISAPDATHPILVSPEHLEYQRYLDRGRAWDVRSDEPFTHVLTRGASGTSIEDTLAVANAGAFNNGTVVLTSYMPGALTSPQDDREAARLLHNLISQSYTMLFLDYGPPIPANASVGSDQRLVAIPHPNVPGAIVEVRLVLYVFST